MKPVGKMAGAGLAMIAIAVFPLRADVRVVGTDLLGSGFSKALYHWAGREGVALAQAFDGSRPGLAELDAGRADVALIVLPEDEHGALDGYRHQPIAYHHVVVLVPAACPLRQLTLPQLAAVFADRGVEPAKNWGDLGVMGDWTERHIHAAVPVGGAGLALEFFRRAVLGDRPMRSSVAEHGGRLGLEALFAGEPATLAIAATVPNGVATLRPVALAKGRGGSAFLPTRDHVHSGEYPLRIAVQVVLRPEREPTLRPLLAWLLGAEAAAEFERAELLALPEGVRAERIAALKER